MSQWVHTQTMQPVEVSEPHSAPNGSLVRTVVFPEKTITINERDFPAKFHRAEKKDTSPLWSGEPGRYQNDHLTQAAAHINAARKKREQEWEDLGPMGRAFVGYDRAPANTESFTAYERAVRLGMELAGKKECCETHIHPDSCVIPQAELDRLRAIEERLEQYMASEPVSNPDHLIKSSAYHSALRYIQTGEEAR